MGLFGEKVYLFSEVKGVITLNGEPLEGARVKRSVEWKDKTYVDEVITASDGSFDLPVMNSGERIVLAELVIYQLIMVEYQGKSWRIWRKTKGSPGLNQELIDWKHPDGIPIQFTCELSDDERLLELVGGVLRTRCRFVEEIGEEIEP